MEYQSNEQQNSEQQVNTPVQPSAPMQPETVQTQTTANETSQESTVDEELIGTVADCDSLNVREAPSASAKIITTIPVLKEVIVDENESTTDFYKISTNEGIKGYCMRKYITIKP